MISASIPINALLLELSEYLNQQFENINNFQFLSSNRVSTYFLEGLLDIPLVLHLPKKTLLANTPIHQDQIITLLKKVHYSQNNIMLLYIFLTFNFDDRVNKQVDCIFIETKQNAFRSEPLINLIALDFMLSKSSKTNSTGKIDYGRLEKSFWETFTKKDYELLLKKPGKYFYQNLLNLNINR